MSNKISEKAVTPGGANLSSDSLSSGTERRRSARPSSPESYSDTHTHRPRSVNTLGSNSAPPVEEDIPNSAALDPGGGVKN